MTTKKDYLEQHKQICDLMHSTTEAKNADYTGGNPDAFYNFTRAEANNVCSVETGMLVRMTDKFSRVIGLVNGHQAQVKSEAIDDTLIDLANYAIIMAIYMREKRKATNV